MGRHKQPSSGSDPASDVPVVLHLLPADLFRGAQTFARALADGLESTRMTQRTATIFRSEDAALRADVQLDTPPGGRKLGVSPAGIHRLRVHLAEERYALVVAHGGEALKYAAAAVRHPTLLVYHKVGPSPMLHRARTRLALHRLLVRRADLVVAVSEGMAEEAETLLGVTRESIVVIPNGRDPAPFSFRRPPADRAVRLVFVGQLAPSKRPEVFIRLISKLAERGLPVEGWLVGDGPLRAELARSPHPNTHFLGHRSDVPEILASSDILVLCSTKQEGMPGVLIEAGLAGLPTLTMDVPGARDVVEDGVTGVIVDLDDENALVDRASALVRAPRLRSEMGKAARDRCVRLFSLDRSLELWASELAGLLPAPGAR